MANITIKFIVKPYLNIQNDGHQLLFEAEKERTVTTTCNTPLRGICIDTMASFGLGHLAHITKVSVRTSDYKYLTFDAYIPDLNLNVGALRHIFGDFLIIKLHLNGKIEDYSKHELKKTLCYNLLNLLIKKYPKIQDCITDITHRNIIRDIEGDSPIKDSFKSLLAINNLLEEELKLFNKTTEESPYCRNTLTNDGGKEIPEGCGPQKSENHDTPNIIKTVDSGTSINNGKTSNNENIQPPEVPTNNSLFNNNETLLEILNHTPPPQILQEKSSKKRSQSQYRSRITFNHKNETPFLEKWFTLTKKPSPTELQQIAEYLNNASNRPEDAKITTQNVKIWFKNRRAKTNKKN
uniref:Homeobox domain-containing protein n=1 Tax=Strongyloides papillosus TaxID=174720 RepID=A0A0N5BD04_STREA